MDEDAIIGGIRYSLHKSDHTAAIFKFHCISSHVIIPRSVTYESEEYIITSINDFSLVGNRNIVSIEFEEDSEIREIEQKAFSDSALYQITFPANIDNLKSFDDSSNISYISISPQNKNFIVIDHMFLIGKSDPKSDVLIHFCL